MQVHTILAVLVLGFLFIHFGIGVGVAEGDHDEQSVIQLTGVLAQGVEAGCIMLQADDGNLYNLLNVTPEHLTFGSRVLVRGYVEKNVATTCMQGTPFRVLEIQSVTVQTSATKASPSTSTTTSALTTTSSINTPEIPLPWESIIPGIIVGLAAISIARRHKRMARGYSSATR